MNEVRWSWSRRAAVTIALIAGTIFAGGGGRLAAQPGPVTVDCGGPYTGVAGQAVVMTASVSFPGAQSFIWDFGDGTMGDQNPTSHVYTAPGEYGVKLRVGFPTLGVFTCETTATIAPAPGVSSPPASAAPPSNQSGPTISMPPSHVDTVVYGAGWNLISGPDGSEFIQAEGFLYTFRAGDADYEPLDPASGVTGGFGYWAYFPDPVVLQFSLPGATSATIEAPPGQWVMIGNPSGDTIMTVYGADEVLRYDPDSDEYFSVTTLQPGQGAWAMSVNGGAITVEP